MKREDKDLMDILLEVCQDEQAELKITRTHINAFFLISSLGALKPQQKQD